MATVTFNATGTGRLGAQQTYTVDLSGDYVIEACGASGGFGGGAPSGGYGAKAVGTFALLAGDVLRIRVGQRGADYALGSTGGGGGTFVVLYRGGAETLLLVAGGGGGVVRYDVVPANAHGSSANGGRASSDGTPGGTGTSGATSGNQTVQGGAGYAGNGSQPSGSGSLPQSWANGSNGGQNTYATPYADGGYGGGGGAARGDEAFPAGGGGGGYAGGAGGYHASNPSNVAYGGGGGSYNSGTSQSIISGFNPGAGYVNITDPNRPPSAPSSVVSQNGSPASVTWVHNDPDGDTQAKYQLRWRKVVV